MKLLLKRFLVTAFLFTAIAAQAEQVIITEIMYNPSGTKAEYIEIKNITWNPRDIVKWKLTDGVQLTFPDYNSGAPGDTFMKAQERIILSSKDAATTRSEYGISAGTRVFGPWTGFLSNSGETITLKDINGVVMGSVDYKTSGRWPKAADGTGHSLMIINENADPDDWHNWTSSPTVKAVGGVSTTTTMFNLGDSWKYLVTPWGSVDGQWNQESFNDASWGTGSGLFVNSTEASRINALGGQQVQTDVLKPENSYIYYFRKSFNFSGSNPATATLVLDQMVDDGVTYYLNGQAIGSSRHTEGELLSNQTPPTIPGIFENGDVLGVETNAVVKTGGHQLKVGNNVLSAEVHQFQAPGNSDVVFGAKLKITSTSGGGGSPSNATVRLSEVHFDVSGRVDWVEIQNTSNSAQNVADLFLATEADLSDKVALSGSIAANGFQSFTIPNGGFSVGGNGDVNIFLADSANNIKDAADLTRISGFDSIQAVWPVKPASKPSWELLRMRPEWYNQTTTSQNAANNPTLTTSIVINEIMNDPMSENASAEYLELHNKTGASVSLTGWKLRGGVDFDFPSGTSVPANGYLVVASNKAYIFTAYGISAVGDWTGNLSNKGEALRLMDQNDNLADEVDYKSGGDWPDLVVYKGSSMELIHPNMDNNRASAWKASNESSKGTWAPYSLTGTWADVLELEGAFASRSAFTTNQNDYKEWLFFGMKDCHIVLRNIEMRENGAGSNRLNNVGSYATNGQSDSGWLGQGTHSQSYMDGEGLHLVATGHGDGQTGRIEIDATANGGINPGNNYTVSFEARWVSGVPLIMGQTWDRSMGGLVRVAVPNNLGTPGSGNSRFNGNTPPQVDSVIHSPAVPKANQSVKVTARVYSNTALSSVEVFHRQDDINTNPTNTGGYSSQTMFDNGTNGDAVSGDGVYTATVTSHQSNNRIVHFYVRANANNGSKSYGPPNPVTGGEVIRPAMWMVDDRTLPTDMRRQRYIIAAYDFDVLKGNGLAGKYNYRYPILSNHYFSMTYIHAESDPYYLCEVRGGGSSWHRHPDTGEPGTNWSGWYGAPMYQGLLRRLKWKLPDDRLFRTNGKYYSDVDFTKNSGLDNSLSLYIAYLIGYPAANEIEMGIHTAVNSQPVLICSETENTDNDLVARVYENGSDGQLIKGSEMLTFKDDFSVAKSSPHDLSYAFRGTDNIVRWHGHFPLRNREWESDYSSFIELVETWSNPSATREQLERIMDSDAVMSMVALRGYAGDWDSFQANGKNGNWYRRPSDNRWVYIHWDGDSAFERCWDPNWPVANQLTGWKEYLNRPWVRRQLNYYLTEILQKWSKNSTRVSTWINLQFNISPSIVTLLQNTRYGPVRGGAGELGSGNTQVNQYPQFFNNREAHILNEINTGYGSGGEANAYTANFQVNSNDGTGGATLVIRGQAPSSAYKIVVDNHPEMVLRWDNQINFKLSEIAMKSGTNNFILRMVDRFGAQVGSQVNYSVIKSGNAAPIMKLELEPDNVKLGELLVIDASTSYDPDLSPLTFSWSSTPSVTMTTPVAVPVNSKRHATFTIPGIYSFTATGHDGTTSTPITREVAVANGLDFESFTSTTIDTVKWTLAGIEVKNNNFPSRWYSLYDVPGQLVMHVSDGSAKNLTYANNHPTLLRNITTGTGPMAILTEVELVTRKTGTFFTGLYLETSEGKYAFGLDNGTTISAKRSTGGGFSDLTNSPAFSEGGSAKLRINRVGDQLRFDRKVDGVWTTLFTHNMAGGSTMSKGGLFLSTSSAENARVAFDYFMLVNPLNGGGSVIQDLRITEIMYNTSSPNDPEYIELRNTGIWPLNLNGVKFTDGVSMTIGAQTLNPGEYGVVSEADSSDFTSRYPGVKFLGTWAAGDSLNNGGEQIELKDAGGNLVTGQKFTYDDASPWPTIADGSGGAIEVINTNNSYNDPTNWRATGVAPGGGADGDGDGIPDAVEAKFGTSTTNAMSKPTASTARNGSGHTVISWPGTNANAQTYRVEYCNNLGETWQILNASVPGVNGTVTHTDTSTTAVTKRFYRIRAM